MWFSDDDEQNMQILDVMRRMLPSSVRQVLGENVEFITSNGTWHLHLASRIVHATRIIFANGGFGATATSEELRHLAVETHQYVHASANTRVLRDLAHTRGWPQDDLNAWFVEFADGAPKWFLWDAAATVIDESAGLVYDESLSYDERGRIRQRRNLTRATLLYAGTSPSMVTTLDDSTWQSIAALDPPKRCDTRSKRLWRNYLATRYGLGTVVNIDECSRRVDSADSIVAVDLYQGIIDTISGPVLDEYQHVASDSSVAVCGNAGSPSLIGMYLAPGSTLGNAFVTGYIAAKYI